MKGWCMAAGVCLALAASVARADGMLSPTAVRCIQKAAAYHGVNVSIMMAIARHESRGNAFTVVRNRNQSKDFGISGINSIHLKELGRFGIGPAELLDECVSSYVGAWHYSKKVHKHGNTWTAVGAYHSETPYFNERYQRLIHNELVDMGVLKGMKLSVPPLRRPASGGH